MMVLCLMLLVCFPREKANDWMEKGWWKKTLWWFLEDFGPAVGEKKTSDGIEQLFEVVKRPIDSGYSAFDWPACRTFCDLSNHILARVRL